MNTYDVVVVGAGFSGIACAEAAAKRNLKTLLLEKKDNVADAIHTTGILVREIADEWQVPERLVNRINGVRLYSPSLDYIDLTAQDYYFLATDTRKLLQWHLQQALQNGASFRTNTKYTQSKFNNGHHMIPDNNIRCRYLVGCDGPRSKVAGNYGLGKNKRFLIGIEAEYPPLDDVLKDRVHVFLDSDLAPGYIGWVVPGVDCTQVGLACRFPRAPELGRFIEKITPVLNLLDQTPVSHRAGLIPCGGIIRFHSHENVLLLGDAAGMVSPLTAGGIHPAVHYGFQAGEYLADYFINEGLPPGKRLEQIVPDFRIKNLLRSFNDHLLIPNRVYNRIFGSVFFRSLAQTIFFHHRGLLTKEAWRDLGRIIFH